jgi:hypothetical protein
LALLVKAGLIAKVNLLFLPEANLKQLKTTMQMQFHNHNGEEIQMLRLVEHAKQCVQSKHFRERIASFVTAFSKYICKQFGV